MTADVVGDGAAQIALNPGSNPDVSINGGELTLSLSGDEGEGINVNSEYWLGDPTEPANINAFSIQNNDEVTHGPLTMSYEFTDESWLENGADQSFITFQVYTGNPGTRAIQFNAPEQNFTGGGKNLTVGSGGVYGPGQNNTSGNTSLSSGDEWYVVIKTDTTGDDVDTDEDLSGDLTLEFDDEF